MRQAHLSQFGQVGGVDLRERSRGFRAGLRDRFSQLVRIGLLLQEAGDSRRNHRDESGRACNGRKVRCRPSTRHRPACYARQLVRGARSAQDRGAGRQAAAQHRECLDAEAHRDATFLNEASSELVRVADRRNENEGVCKWVGTIERRQARDDLSRLPAARPAGDYFDCWHAAIVGNGYGTYKCSMCRLCDPACPC